MDINALIKSYYFKFALPVVILTVICESAFTPNSYLGSKLT